MREAAGLRARAVTENSAGRPAEAVALLHQALGVLEGRPRTRGGAATATEADTLRFRTMLTLALSEFELGGLAAAAPVFAAARGLADSLPGDGLLPQWQSQHGLVVARSGDLAAARDELEAAVARLDAFTPPEQVSLLLNLGMLRAEDRTPGRAAELFRTAGSLAEEHGLTRQLFMARHNEGYAAYLTGDLPRALALMRAAEQVEADVSLAPALLDHGRALLEAGLLGEADDTLGRAVTLSVDRGQSQVLGEVLLDRARTRLLLTDLDSAADLAERAREHFQARASPALADRARLALLDIALARGHDPASVRQDADRLTGAAEARGDTELAARARLVAAEAALEGGEEDVARARVDRLPRRPPTLLRTALQLAYVRARAAQARGDAVASRRLVRGGARELTRGQAMSASLDLRAARALHGVRLAELDLELAIPRGVTEVLTALERWTAATSRLPTVRPPRDAEAASLYERLRQLRERLREQPDGDAAARWRREARGLERRIRAHDWTHAHDDVRGPSGPGGGSGGEAVTRASLRRARGELTATGHDLLWVFSHDGDVWGLTLRGGRGSLHRLLSEAEAEELARRVHADLRATARHLGNLRGFVLGSLTEGLERADSALVRPCGVGDAPLVVVTCRALSTLPWSMLPSLHEVPLTLAPSLTGFTARTRPAGGSPPSEWTTGGPRVHLAAGPRLPRSGEEADGIARAWRAAGVEVGSSGTRDDLVGALGRPGLVHVAAHGTHEPDSPLFSSLLLEDGPVFAHELQPHGITSGHVVLSACDVGNATVLPGEESLGMAQAMLSLGAGCVVAALSPVPDDVAAETMVRYHAALARGAGSDEALSEARLGGDPLAGSFVAIGGRWRREQVRRRPLLSATSG